MKKETSVVNDATKLIENLEVHTGERMIMDGEYPDHLINMDGLSCKEIKSILDGNSDNHMSSRKVTEVKVAVLSPQNTPPGHDPSIKIAA